MNGPFPWGYPQPPYPPQAGVIYVPVPSNNSPKAPKSQRKLAKMAKQTLVQRLVDLDKEREDIERYLKSKEAPKKDEPKGFLHRTFTFAEITLITFFLFLPATFVLNRIAALLLK